MDADYRILCAVDGSTGSQHALDLVASLPIRPHDDVLVVSRPPYVLAARPGDDGPIARGADGLRRRTRDIVDAAVARLVATGVRARGDVIDGDDAVDAIARVASREDASLIVVGSRGRGPWTSILLGSTARSLAITSAVPVLIARDRPVPPVRVIAAVDGSESSRAALRAFARMPQTEGASVELVHVLPLYDWGAGDDKTWGIRDSVEHDEEARAEELVASLRALAPLGVDVRTHLARGHVADTILARAEDMGADLIVIGTHGMSGRRQLFWGSTAERVLTLTRTNVLVASATA